MRIGKVTKIILGILLLVFVLIQLVPSEIPEVSFENEGDLFAMPGMDEEVAGILRNSCYDCHSNETSFPWYSFVAPMKWLVVKDINDGRKELNFSDWNNLGKREQIKILEEMMEEIEEGNMPLPVYTIIHRDARLNEDQRNKLSEWTASVTEKIFGE
ncbi:MAG: heme-binding domain-containing protein [Cyclobacteriaceae bacterium]|nr:heme-binding domain-containing protein [Cyclobacteriaceae bacterium]